MSGEGMEVIPSGPVDAYRRVRARVRAAGKELEEMTVLTDILVHYSKIIIAVQSC